MRKVLCSEETEYAYVRSSQPQPKIGLWLEELDRSRAANAARPPGSAITARRWRRPRSLCAGRGPLVRRCAPGEAYQLNWSHKVVRIDCTTVTVKVAQVQLCHSRASPRVMIHALRAWSAPILARPRYPSSPLSVRSAPREYVIRTSLGHVAGVFNTRDTAFAFFGGACTCGIYNTMRDALDAVFVGRERAYNRRPRPPQAHRCLIGGLWPPGRCEAITRSIP